MPGKRAQRSKQTEFEDQVTGANLAHIEGSNESIDVTPASNKQLRHMSNIPVQICETGVVQKSSKKAFRIYY
jgi:hypothetical protein